MAYSSSHTTLSPTRSIVTVAPASVSSGFHWNFVRIPARFLPLPWTSPAHEIDGRERPRHQQRLSPRSTWMLSVVVCLDDPSDWPLNHLKPGEAFHRKASVSSFVLDVTKPSPRGASSGLLFVCGSLFCVAGSPVSCPVPILAVLLVSWHVELNVHVLTSRRRLGMP